MKDATNLRADLDQFTGTERWHRHWLGQLLYTDGVTYFVENAGGGAYWLLDIIATEILPLNKRENFIHIVLSVDCNEGVINCDDGNDNPLYTRQLEYTDCPGGNWDFYLEGGVLLLPSEH